LAALEADFWNPEGVETMAKKLTWKQKFTEQPQSHCGRYWFVELRELERDGVPWSNWGDGEVGQFRLWHADTCVIVGHYATKSEAKAAAEKHLAGFAEEVRQLRHRVVDLKAACEKRQLALESLTCRDAN
jgi:hypothetical protein